MNRIFVTIVSSFVFSLSLCHTALARSYMASTASEINSIAATLRPGDELIIRNGRYNNFDISVPASGTASQLIYIRAETPEGVTFGGTSRFVVEGQHVQISGLKFDSVSIAPIILLQGGDSRVTENVFLSSGAAGAHAKHLVRAQSNNNRIDNNYFEDCLSKCAGVIQRSFRNRIDNNTFKNLRRFGQEEVEAIQIGQGSGDFPTVTKTVIENNTFENASGTSEIISIKSSGVVVRHNTFINSRGQLTLRGGRGNRVEGNTIIGSRNGILVNGPDHVVINNLIINSEQSGILLTGQSGKHAAADDCLVANNTISGFTKGGITVERSSGGTRPANGIRIFNNLISGRNSTPLAIVNPASHSVRRNLLWSNGGAVGFAGDEAIVQNPLLVGSGKSLTISTESPAIDRALSLEEVTLDRNAFSRIQPDIGADERTSPKLSKPRPPNWVFWSFPSPVLVLFDHLVFPTRWV